MTRDKSSGGTGRILLIIHTHPPHDPVQMAGPYANNEQLAALQNWSPSVVTGDPNVSTADSMNLGSDALGYKTFFGLVVYGKGKFTVYGRGKRDIETLKRTCVKP